MCHQPSHLLVTSHSSAPRCCVVQQWRALCSVCTAAFTLNSLLSICNQNDFLISHFIHKNACYQVLAILHYFRVLLRPSRSRCNKFFCGKSQPIRICLYQAKSFIIFLSSHHTSLTHFAKNLRYHPKQWHTTHPRHSCNISLPPYTYYEHNGSHAVCSFCAAAILLPRMSNYFFAKKTLSDWLRKSNSLTLQDQSHTSIRLNTPSHSFNPALCNTKHYSPLAEYAVVAIQTKCIYYSTAALAYYPHMC